MAADIAGSAGDKNLHDVDFIRNSTMPGIMNAGGKSENTYLSQLASGCRFGLLQGARAMSRMLRLACTGLCMIFLSACATSGAGVRADAPPADATQAVKAYQIGVDDVVQVSVWRNPELGITVPVRPDGKISVPLIGDVAAGGRTPEQVADDIKQKLTAYVRDPQVAVILTELRSHEYL